MSVRIVGNVNLSTTTEPLSIAWGGTGQSTAEAAFNALAPLQTGNSGKVLTTNGTSVYWSSTGTGSVTSVAASGSDGITVSGSPITSSGTISLGLGDITPTSLAATGTVSGSNLSGTNTGDETATTIKSKLGITTLSGSNTGDQTITLTGDVTGSGTGSFSTTLATVNLSPVSNAFSKVTTNGKGLVTATSSVGSSDIITALGYTPEDSANKNQANGYAGLDSNGLIASNQLPSIAITDTFVVSSQSAMLALTAQVGDIAVRTDIDTTFILQTAGASTLANWVQLTSPSAPAVTSISATGANGITVSGSPITSNGTLAFGLGNITPTSVAATSTVTGSNLSGTNTGDETTATIKSKLGITTLSGSNTGDQTITLTGDITGSGTGSFAATLSTTGVTAGAYTNANVTVDAKGRVTAISNGSAAGGTVTSVSVASANGFAGTVATETSTPAITLSTTVTGIIKGNGTSISAATAGTDYIAPSGSTTFTALQTFNGSSSTLAARFLNTAESVNIVSAAPASTQTFYVNNGSVQYYTSNAANNWTINVAFTSSTSLNTAMSVGDSVTVAMVTSQGSVAYYPTTIQIDGVSLTPGSNLFWQNGVTPTAGYANGKDVYTFTIIKTASATYTVLASQTQY